MSARAWLLAGVASLLRCSASGYGESQCPDLRPQSYLDLSQMMGMWYGVEVIQHAPEDGGGGGAGGLLDRDACPILHISDITHELTSTESHLRPGDFGYAWTAERGSGGAEGRFLRLYWDNRGRHEEHYLKYNHSRKGAWEFTDPQNDAGYRRLYDREAGSVQVMKAVVDHAVLTFCLRLPHSQFFSVVLSRKPDDLGAHTLRSVRSLLSRRDLSTSSARRVCGSAAAPRGSLLSLLLLLAVLGVSLLSR